MKIRLILSLGLLLLMGDLSAQNKPPHLSKEDVIAKKWEFMVQKTNLSVEDANKVEPLFKAAELETWSLIEQNRAIQKMNRNKSLNDKVDYEAINESMINFQVNNALVQKNYYLKLKNVIAPDLIHQLLIAEKQYKRELMSNVHRRKNTNSRPPQQ